MDRLEHHLAFLLAVASLVSEAGRHCAAPSLPDETSMPDAPQHSLIGVAPRVAWPANLLLLLLLLLFIVLFIVLFTYGGRA